MTCNYRIEARTSKAGKAYKVIIFTFSNGYELEEFLTNEQEFIIGLCNKK